MDGCGYMELKAYGKINLSIDVIGQKDDGYHEIRTIMQSIGLYDVINFEKRKDGIKIYCSNPLVPCDRRNIAYKAFELIKEKYDINSGIEIEINKNIPVSAGLAGGSTDGAATIVAANSLWNLGMDYGDMVDIAKMLGADVPFCIRGGTALAEGIGDVLSDIDSLDRIDVVLAKPPVSVSTKEVYKNLRMDEIIVRPDIDKLIDAIRHKNIRYIAGNMVNVLETVSIKRYPIIEEIKSIMLHFGALGALMSGSGPTVFGLFDSKESGEKCYNRLIDYIKEVYIVKTIGKY